MTLERHSALSPECRAGDQLRQSGLARPGRPNHCSQCPRSGRERDVVQQGSVLLDGQGGTADLQAAGSGRRAGLLSADQRSAGVDEVEIADRHHVALVQRRRVDPDPVDERAVDGACVLDLHSAARRDDHRVMAGGQHVGDHDVVVGGTPDGHRRSRGSATGDAPAAGGANRRRGQRPTGGRGAEPVCRSIEKARSGPVGSPMLRCCPSLRATVDTRRPSTNMPLRLPLSVASHRPPSQRSTRWARETNRLATCTSACGSRPTTMPRPGAKVRREVSD